MPAASVPNSIVNGEPITATPVDDNFTYLEDWLNTNAIQADGSKAFAVLPTAPADVLPSVDTQLITKKVLDDRTALIVNDERTASQAGVAYDNTFRALDVVTPNFTMPIIPAGRVFTVSVMIPVFEIRSRGGWPAGGVPMDVGIYMGINFGAMVRIQLGRSLTPGAPQYMADAASSLYMTRTFKDNTQFPAGTSQKIELRGRLPIGDGEFNVSGRPEHPIQVMGRMN